MWFEKLSQISRFTLLLAVMVTSVLASAGAFAPARAGAPVLVIAPPWGDGPAVLLQAAGGQEITPLRAPFAVLGVLDEPELLQGAWALWDATALARLCGLELDESWVADHG